MGEIKPYTESYSKGTRTYEAEKGEENMEEIIKEAEPAAKKINQLYEKIAERHNAKLGREPDVYEISEEGRDIDLKTAINEAEELIKNKDKK